MRAGGLLTLLLTGLLLLSSSASAQEFRATVSGTITDPSGAVVPGATIEVRETSTGTLNRTVSDAAGQYVVPFLLPGNYTIKTTAKGFETLTRNNIALHAQDHIVVDQSLIVGSANQTVTVNSAPPLLDTANASVNTVISTSSVADLPLNGRAPSTLAELSAGVITTAAPEQVHPFDNNAGNAWSIGGTPNQVSEVLLDGSPDETLLGALAFSPVQDSVQEVSVQPFATDASFGHTIGGVINMVTKSGANRLHGTMYEFGQISGIDANLFFNDKSYNVVNGVPTEKALPVFHFNQYGVTAGGPVSIPKIVNGKNKVFFFFAWEGLKDSTPASTLLTVPTTTSIAGSPGTGGEASGDFYQLLVAGCPNGFNSNTAAAGAQCNPDSSNSKVHADPYQLYDPRSGNAATYASKGTVVRAPIYNNQLTSVYPNLDAVGLAYMKLFPAPTSSGTNSLGQNNYDSNAPSIDNYNEEFGRLDYNVSSSDHLFLDARHNIRGQLKNNYFGNNTTGTTLTRENWGTTIDNVYTMSPTTIFDTRVNWTLFYESHGTPAQAYSPTTLGQPGALVTSSFEPELPYANFNGTGSSCTTTSFECLGDTGSALDPTTSYQAFVDMIKIVGRHTFKVGFDGRQYRLSVQNFADASGSFTYDTSWTNAGTGGATKLMGYDLAALLLGVPSTGEYDLNARADYHSYYVGTFIQDDWRLNNRLTLNLGLRYDTNTPFEERLGRTVNGFSPTATVTYAGTPAWTSTTETVNGQSFTVPSINLNGGLTYPSGANGAVFNSNSGFFSPRVGFSYEINPKTVLRGGGGVFLQPETMSNEAATGVTSSNALSNQEGFSASTSYVTSTIGYDPGGTNSNTLENPFPTLSAPTGSSLGASTFLGAPAALNFLAPNQHELYSERWNLGVQRTLSNSLMIEAMYVGNHGVHLPVGTHNINAILPQYLSTTPYFNYNLNKAYGTKVTNPFYKELGASNTTGLNSSSTESFSNYIVPFPQFGTGSITEQNMTIGQSWFDSGILHVEKRSSNGLTLTANYSFSKMIEADSFRNDEDSFLERRISPFDHTHHFTAGGSYELPFGRGKQFSFNGSRLWDEIAGGYVINGIYQFQTGAPIYFSSDLVLAPGYGLHNISSKPRNVSQTSPQTTQALGAQALSTAPFVISSAPSSCTTTCDGSVNQGGQYVDHYRTLPTTLSWVRMDGYNNLDASILKDFHFTESSYFQLRFETFNTLNHPVFASPTVSSATSGTFGVITGTTASSLPRQIQIGGRIVF
jgi:hypothetical protein